MILREATIKYKGYDPKDLKDKSNRKVCIKLNTYFEGSNEHHISSGVIIYMSKNLHNYFYHELKNNKNMNEINKIAWNYLVGNY